MIISLQLVMEMQIQSISCKLYIETMRRPVELADPER